MGEEAKISNPATPIAAETPITGVKFIHEKSPQYRIFHIDSGWGSINNLGNFQIDLCVEHSQTPNMVIQKTTPEGNFTGEIVTDIKEEPGTVVVVRDFQCGLVLSFGAAVQIHNLLDNYIKTTKQQMDSAIAQIKQRKQ